MTAAPKLPVPLCPKCNGRGYVYEWRDKGGFRLVGLCPTCGGLQQRTPKPETENA